MKVVVQRVLHASVEIENEIYNKIDRGFLLLVGIEDSDDTSLVEKMADKILKLRVFEDENEKMNLSLEQVSGSILSISQFTLFANCAKGNRPGFDRAGKHDHAKRLYEYFNAYLNHRGCTIKDGIFGADMKVSLLNDGPVTIILDSKEMWNR